MKRFYKPVNPSLVPIVIPFILILELAFTAEAQDGLDRGISKQQMMIRSSNLIKKVGDGVSVGRGPAEIAGHVPFIEFTGVYQA